MPDAYAGLRMAARAGDPKPDPNEDETPDEGCEAGPDKKKEDDMSDANNETAIAQAKAEGFAEANTRFQAVLASDDYAGREQLAHTLLGNDKLSADEIIQTLAAAEKKQPAVAAAGEGDAEAAARAEMRAALEENGNSDVEPGAAPSLSKDKAADAVWASVLEDMNLTA